MIFTTILILIFLIILIIGIIENRKINKKLQELEKQD